MLLLITMKNKHIYLHLINDVYSNKITKLQIYNIQYRENDEQNKYLQERGKSMINIGKGKSNNLFQTSLML